MTTSTTSNIDLRVKNEMRLINKDKDGAWWRVKLAPSVVEFLLGRNTENRKARPSVVRSLANEFKTRGFIANGSTFVVSRDFDRLLDGQHRLLAVREAGITPTVTVFETFGESVETMGTIDCGGAGGRTSRDLLRVAGIPNYNGVSAAIRMYLFCAVSHSSIHPARVLRFYENHRDDIETVMGGMLDAKFKMTGSNMPNGFWAAALNAYYIGADGKNIHARCRSIISGEPITPADREIAALIIKSATRRNYNKTFDGGAHSVSGFYKMTKGFLDPDLKVLRIGKDEDVSKLRAGIE